VESAVDTQAEALMQHSQVVEGVADTVQVVELGHYREAVVMFERKNALVLGS
jgi:hypothetical protein